jgi:hypothetical protein
VESLLHLVVSKRDIENSFGGLQKSLGNPLLPRLALMVNRAKRSAAALLSELESSIYT